MFLDMKFTDWLRANKISGRKAAEATGMSKSKMAMIIRGDTVPNIHEAAEIIRWSRGEVTLEDFLSDY